MGWIQIIVVALVVIGIIAWRIHRLVSFFRSGRSVWYKAVVGLVIVIGLVSRVSRAMRASDADASVVADSAEVGTAPAAAKATDSAPAAPAEGPSALIAQGESALGRCDTATANGAFRQLAKIAIDRMNADSLDGTPLFLQGVALAGLRDSANAKVLATEAIRLDGQRHIPANPTRAALLQRMIALAGKRC